MSVEVVGPQALGHYVDGEGRITGYICGGGCCSGCWRCAGSGMGCHQMPCRCKRPCKCDQGNYWEDDQVAPVHCQRHGGHTDRRPKEWPPTAFSSRRCPTCDPHQRLVSKPDCPTCGGWGTIVMAQADVITRCLEPTPRAKLYKWGYRVCSNTAGSYIWRKNGPKGWHPVCGVHRKRYVREDNIMEESRI